MKSPPNVARSAGGLHPRDSKDKNGDGGVSRDEFHRALEPHREEGSEGFGGWMWFGVGGLGLWIWLRIGFGRDLDGVSHEFGGFYCDILMYCMNTLDYWKRKRLWSTPFHPTCYNTAFRC